jgi:hypothetical protein
MVSEREGTISRARGALNPNSFFDPIRLSAQLYGDVEGPVCSESYRRQSACSHKTGLLRMVLSEIRSLRLHSGDQLPRPQTLQPTQFWPRRKHHYFGNRPVRKRQLVSWISHRSPHSCGKVWPGYQLLFTEVEGYDTLWTYCRRDDTLRHSRQLVFYECATGDGTCFVIVSAARNVFN